MYYKVLKNNNVIDVLDRLVFLKYQPKHQIMLLCGRKDAQAIKSSDGTQIWHVNGFSKLPVDGYSNVDIVEIDETEYKNLKIFQVDDPHELIDNFVLMLLQNNII